MLVLSHLALTLIRSHVEVEYPHEGCGLLLGRRDEDHGSVRRSVERIKPLQNAAGEGRRSRYVIAPDDYVRVDREARAQGLEIVGVYHSHPDHAGAPSATDTSEAWPNLAYLILPVMRGSAGASRVWLLPHSGGHFEEDSLEIED